MKNAQTTFGSEKQYCYLLLLLLLLLLSLLLILLQEEGRNTRPPHPFNCKQHTVLYPNLLSHKNDIHYLSHYPHDIKYYYMSTSVWVRVPCVGVSSLRICPPFVSSRRPTMVCAWHYATHTIESNDPPPSPARHVAWRGGRCRP